MRRLTLAIAVAVLVAAVTGAAGQRAYRTHTDRYDAPKLASLEAWKGRAQYLREHILASAGLLPTPEKTPLKPSIFDDIPHADYIVSKVHFESLPGFLVTGNLYRPVGNGPFPAIVSPHGHWTYGRLENTVTTSGPARAIGLARQGFVVFTYDMIGYADSQQLPHTFGGAREHIWGLSLAGLQLWNSIRAVDFLQTLSYVRRDAIGATGESGGGTQTFLLAAVDDRIAVAAPVNMISLHMQGGCLCENPPGLRLDTTNVELAATIAPRPLLMVSATGDWTKETLEAEYPAVRSVYGLFGAIDRVHAVRIDAEHNYNKASREAMYAWMARWLQGASADVRVNERSFTVEPLQNLLVFFNRPRPADTVDAATVTRNWMASAKRQLASGPPAAFATALRHVLGFGDEPVASIPSAKGRDVLIATSNAEVEKAITAAGLRAVPMAFTPFEADAASKIRHFETYNRTATSQRVADIVSAIRAHPGAPLVADGDAALAAVLASAVISAPVAVLDVGTFDTSNETAYVDRLYMPGLRRAGDFQTAVASSRGRLVLHNAGETFKVTGADLRTQQLTARDILSIIRAAR
jgi:dienelactone hydrolase